VSYIDEKAIIKEEIAQQSSTTEHETKSSLRLSGLQTISFIARLSQRDWKILLFSLANAILAGLTIPV
jgi:ATP-binding cassette subfamily B (MDR/TAP) protein 1